MWKCILPFLKQEKSTANPKHGGGGGDKAV